MIRKKPFSQLTWPTLEHIQWSTIDFTFLTGEENPSYCAHIAVCIVSVALLVRRTLVTEHSLAQNGCDELSVIPNACLHVCSTHFR